MTLTATQVWQAIALLRWSSPKLAKASKVSFDLVIKGQDDPGTAALPFGDVWAIRMTLEKAGVRFEVDAIGSPGAVLVKV